MKRVMKNSVACADEVFKNPEDLSSKTYKDYSFNVKRNGNHFNTVIVNNLTGQRYETRNIEEDDILCIIATYPDGDLVTPIEENMITMRNASSLSITEILDYLDRHLI